MDEISKGLSLIHISSEYREAFAKYANAPEAFKLGDVNTDWQDEIYRVAMGTDHNLSI